MLENVQNLLYRRPELYELVYPEPNSETACMCRRLFQRFLPGFPASILDVGCGTGRDLAGLAGECTECVGVDAIAEMISYARSKHPQLTFHVGDMRTVRLGRSFDAILCMGSALMYALANADVDATLSTFAAHAHDGTLLILDVNNAAGYLGGGCFRPESEMEVAFPEFTAKARATFSFDRRRQRLIRTRTWFIPGQSPVEDYCEYRLFFPEELHHRLHAQGFEIVGTFDNMELQDSDLSGPRLYVAAIYQA
jgi:SAM-dependent methyltransferase